MPLVVNIPKRIALVIAGVLPVAVLTASQVPWQWGFVLTYLLMSFSLQVLIRFKNEQTERFAHIVVLSGSAPFVVRSYFGKDLTIVGVAHIAALLALSVGAGYLLAHPIRPLVRAQHAV